MNKRRVSSPLTNKIVVREVLAQRPPLLLLRFVLALAALLRSDTRAFVASLFQLPPRKPQDFTLRRYTIFGNCNIFSKKQRLFRRNSIWTSPSTSAAPDIRKHQDSGALQRSSPAPHHSSNFKSHLAKIVISFYIYIFHIFGDSYHKP